MKTNFSTQTVSGNVSFSFDQMATMTSIFESAALEALEKNDSEEAANVVNIAARLGFDVDVEVPDFTQQTDGRDSEQTE